MSAFVHFSIYIVLRADYPCTVDASRVVLEDLPRPRRDLRPLILCGLERFSPEALAHVRTCESSYARTPVPTEPTPICSSPRRPPFPGLSRLLPPAVDVEVNSDRPSGSHDSGGTFSGTRLDSRHPHPDPNLSLGTLRIFVPRLHWVLKSRSGRLKFTPCLPSPSRLPPLGRTTRPQTRAVSWPVHPLPENT